MEHKCTLKSLYKSNKIRQIIIKELNMKFDSIFNVLLRNVTINKPYLCVPARYLKEEIRDLFINEGYKLDCVEDLENILDFLKVWNLHDFKEAKERYI
jgi:hypothetical protein